MIIEDFAYKITVIIPVLDRPKNLEPLLESFKNNTDQSKASLLFITGQNCKEEIAELNRLSQIVLIAPDECLPWSQRINYGINHSDTPWLLCGADDIRFHPFWLEIAEEAMKDFSGIIGTNDLGHPATIGGWHTTHPIVSRDYIEQEGTMDEPGKFCHEGYRHNYVDVEFVHTAMKRGKWKHVPTCIIEHIHPSWNKAKMDEVYEFGSKHINQDRDLWVKRKAQFNL